MISHRGIVPFLCAVFAGQVSGQATRGPEVERLSLLVGNFEGEVRYAPPGAPARIGRMSYQGEWDLDRWIVRSRYEQTMPGSPAISGLLIFRWRPRDSSYAFEAYANTPMEPHRLTGRWNDQLVFEGKNGNVEYRERWHLVGSDTLITSMEFLQNGEWLSVSKAILVRRHDTRQHAALASRRFSR